MKGKPQRVISQEFKQEAVQLVLTSGKSATQIAQDLGVSDSALSRWVGDITVVPTQEGWWYMAALLDLYSRRCVGWAMSAHPRHVCIAHGSAPTPS